MLALSAGKAHAQLNRDYFYYVAQQCIVQERYREAIDVLGILLRRSEEHTSELQSPA